MVTILERLRTALAPEYEVERLLVRGGMGTVFLARDAVLQRPVAVKILRPELATARAVERFLREARVLASLTHPNVVPVHRAGEADGLPYYVMDYIEGETLADRLASGPLSPPEALKLGRDLLDALEAVHGLGVIHRDIKPTNIFLLADRALLCDFGIARDLHSGATTGDGISGTPGYMPPEHAFGWNISVRTDLYAAAMVVYEAFTGRRWTAMLPEEKPDWSGVPRRMIPLLRKALAWSPSDRWPDARTFRRAIWRTRTRKYRRRTLLLTLGGVVAGALAAISLLWPPTTTSDVAVLPFSGGPGDSTIAEDLTTLTRYNLEPFMRRAQLRLASAGDVEAWRKTCGSPPDQLTSKCIHEARARYLVSGSLTRTTGPLSVDLDLIARDGTRRDAGRLAVTELSTAGHRLGHLIARVVAPEHESDYPGSTALSRRDPALISFLDGLRAFKRNSFRTAVSHFEDALRADPDFPLAAWWLSNAWRWNVTGEPHGPVDLRVLLATRGSDLPELDSLLIEAQLAPGEAARLAAYRLATERYPRNGYAAFLYGEESQSRGPHVGIGLDASTERLETALRTDSSFAPTLYHLLWAYIRQGNRERAERLLPRFTAVSAPRDEVQFYQPPLMAFAIAERFHPERAAATRGEIRSQPDDAAALAEAFRLTAMLGLYRTLAEVGAALAAAPVTSAAARADAYEGQGLGRIALGQIPRGLAHLDSAAALRGSPAARLEPAEWRVLGRVLGIPGLTSDAVAAGRAELEALARRRPELRPRAAWALGMLAVAAGDGAAAARWAEVLGGLALDPAAVRLGAQLDAAGLGARGAFRDALARSAALLPFDSAARGGDPFARALLHVQRAAWLDSLGRPEAADSTRLWYEHFEFVRIPVGPAQAAEIDWAIGPHVMWVRGDQAARRGRRPDACRHFSRVLELWTDADPAFAPQITRAREEVRRSCR